MQLSRPLSVIKENVDPEGTTGAVGNNSDPNDHVLRLIEGLTAQVEGIKDENMGLRAKVEGIRDENVGLRAKVEGQDSRIEHLQKENDERRNECIELHTEQNKLRQALVQAQQVTTPIRKWNKINNRVIGHILRSPPIGLGVSEQHFTEDWGVFVVDRTKLGDGFQGNKMDLGTKMKPNEFTVKCFPRGHANWEFEYPEDRLLPLEGVITGDLIRAPDMCDPDGEPCLLVAKRGNATGTTLGRANGIFSIVREYFSDMSINQTSMESYST